MFNKNTQNKSEIIVNKIAVKKIAINTLIVFSVFLFCLLLLELSLRTGWFDDEDNPHPVWIPHKFRKINDEINRKNWQFAKQNPYRFTDKIRDVKKKKGLTRVAVLGDSVVWGYAIPYELAWGHKLEGRVIEKYKNYEVLNWGFNAWSTLEELSFLEQDGVKYNINMLIVSFTNTNPYFGDIKEKVFQWHKFTLIKILKVFFPNAVSFLTSNINNFLRNHFFEDYGYDSWLKRIYSNENLQKYLELLQDFSRFCNSQNIKLLFVLVPDSIDEIHREQFDKIIPLLKKAHIKYLDLLPPVKKKLGHINKRKLWANPANRHPGALLTDVYANEVFDYLEKRGTFSHDKVSYIQELTVRALGARKDTNAIDALVITALKDADWDVRKEAAVTLGEINDPRAVDSLIAALKDENSDVRESAVEALGEINDPRIVEPLIAALKDEDKYVRLRIVLTLEKIKKPRVVEPLIAALKDEDKYVRRRAVWALGEINGPRAVVPLTDALMDKSYYVRKSVVIALGKIKDPRVVDFLVAALKDEYWEVRIEAVKALGEIKDPRVVDILKIVSLEDKDLNVRDLAAIALKKITGKHYGRVRRKLLRLWKQF